MPEGELLSWVLVGTLCACSVGVWVTAALRIRNGVAPLEAEQATIPTLPVITVILAAALVLSKLAVLLEEPVSEVGELPTNETLLSAAGLNVLLLALLALPLVLSTSSETPLTDFGFRLDRMPTRLWQGLMLFVASALPVVLFMIVSLPLRTEESEHALLQLFSSESSLITRGLICMMAVVIAPVLEELIYRVILQTWLARHLASRDALIITAVIFATVHRLPDAIPLLPLALVLGYAWQQKRCFVTIVVIHMLFNAANLLLVLLAARDAAG